MVFDITKRTNAFTMRTSLDLFFTARLYTAQEIMNIINKSVFKKEEVLLHLIYMAESQIDYH